jgi:hypothetical protein
MGVIPSGVEESRGFARTFSTGMFRLSLDMA